MPSATQFVRLRAAAVSRLSRYATLLVQYQPLPHDDGAVMEACLAPRKALARDPQGLKRALQGAPGRRLVLLNGNLNYSLDIQALLQSLQPILKRQDRVLVMAYNPYWAWLHHLAKRLGLRRGDAPSTFLTRNDLAALARLSDFEVVRGRPLGVLPFRWLGLGALLDRVFSALPLVRETAFAMLLVLRPLNRGGAAVSLSIVVPARDEKGNVENALRRLPRFPAPVEVLFVEGNSSDGTWEEIQRVMRMPWRGITVRVLKQAGRGKADAVRLGLSRCRNELLTVLDADLTMPPELLPRFYETWVSGKADFVNGSRLAYPMEGEAMRVLNWLGNEFFAKALSFTLEQPLGDSLCGTKLFSRADYALMLAWNRDFGRFDPFGDYEMIFPAAELGLGCVDVPIRYRARTYGSTKINRFRDGLILLRMTAVGLWRVRLGMGR
jgi:Glycosyl transferase family 2